MLLFIRCNIQDTSLVFIWSIQILLMFPSHQTPPRFVKLPHIHCQPHLWRYYGPSSSYSILCKLLMHLEVPEYLTLLRNQACPIGSFDHSSQPPMLRGENCPCGTAPIAATCWSCQPRGVSAMSSHSDLQSIWQPICRVWDMRRKPSA